MKKVLFFSLISMFTIFYSCKEETIEVITTSSDTLSVKPLFASEVLTISATSAWSASSSNSWCTMSDSVGTTQKVILVSCQSNLTGLPREATITVHANKQTKAVVVKQAGGTVLFADDFNDNTNNWIVPYPGDSLVSTISNGSLNLKNSARGINFLHGTRLLISDYSGNYVISTNFKIIAGSNPFGITFGYKDGLNFYRLLVFPSGALMVSQKLNGVYTTVKSMTTTYFKNQNTISVYKSGDVCYVYLNDNKITTFNYSPFGPSVGFYSTPQTEVMIDYLRVNKF